MGDNRLVRVAIAAALGCSLLAQPVAAQSLGDRFKSLFGGKSDEPAPSGAPPAGAGNTDPAGPFLPPAENRARAPPYSAGAAGQQPAVDALPCQAPSTNTA